MLFFWTFHVFGSWLRTLAVIFVSDFWTVNNYKSWKVLTANPQRVSTHHSRHSPRLAFLLVPANSAHLHGYATEGALNPHLRTSVHAPTLSAPSQRFLVLLMLIIIKGSWSIVSKAGKRSNSVRMHVLLLALLLLCQCCGWVCKLTGQDWAGCCGSGVHLAETERVFLKPVLNWANISSRT